jgi:hypothetical protein
LAETIEIRSSPAKLLGVIAGAILLTLVSALIAARILPGVEPGSFQQFVGYCGLVFFGFCTLAGIWMLFTARGPIVTISSEGIRDTRITSDIIPWSAVHKISTWRLQRQKAMVLAVDPAVEERLNLSRMVRMTRKANIALGADGLCVTAQGIKIDYDTLLSTSLKYWKTATGG